MVRRKSAPYSPYVPPEPTKKLKQTTETLKSVSFKINVSLLQGNLKIERIKECEGNTREDVKYVCEL